MRSHPQPHAPRAAAALTPFLEIARRGLAFTAHDGQAFLRLPVPASDGFTIFPVRSQAFRDWFFNASHAALDRIPSPQSFAHILNFLEARAAADPDNQRLSVFRRIGARGQSVFPTEILLDLANADAQFVAISPTGWKVCAGDNALLQLSRATRELAIPADVDDPVAALEILRSALNLPSRTDWLRCLVWLLTAFRPLIPYPILVLQGPSGCGKSFVARILRMLIDPTATPLAPLPHNTGHLFSLARQHWVLAFDHVSKLSPQLTDAFCRLTTGAGSMIGETSRQDFSREPLLQSFRRPLIFTVTPDFELPPAFAARAITVHLPQIPAARRRSEADLRGTIADAYPQILGGLCAVVSTALSRIASIRPTQSPCLADTFAWALAAAPAIGASDSEIQDAFVQPVDPVLAAIEALLGPESSWSGTPSELLELLPPSPHFNTPWRLTFYLNHSLSLLAAGICIAATKPGGKRRIRLFRPTQLQQSKRRIAA